MLKFNLCLVMALALWLPVFSSAMSVDEFNTQVNAMRKGKEKPEKIIEFVEKAEGEIQNAPASVKSNAKSVVAQAYADMGQHDKAMQICADALKLEPTDVAYATKGNLLMAQKDYAGAYDSFKQALTVAHNEKTKQALEAQVKRIRDKYLTVSSKTIYQDFEDNEVAAEDRYKDKKLFVNGKIAAITTDPMGNPCVSLDGGKDGFGKVVCVFPKDSRKEIGTLKKGQPVVIYGKCYGMTLQQVFIRDCSIPK